ncbi:hypothetical protein MTsPCn9_03220 [Croceitalea sp. MTPC9]|uniref:WD40/YVTN/BNR-like repeat-containing protein n=1 Tax=unclassified Croceitalea TaxID=2632280 RepID=UPI002B39141E|nr:hypothetical protein MTsPCn6_05490 [Croceitalea sp. MTPC6]GMN15386.1 hypothetical protein MTsPCn9_03220 [Croceitalea sp. MTPC9]
MKPYFFFLLFGCILISCQSNPESHNYTSVTITTIFEDSVSIRAIEFLDSNTLAFAGSKGIYGTVEANSGKARANNMKYHTSIPEFRAVAHTSTDFFMLSVANPALLYKTGDNGKMDLVYIEEGEGVFYDAMKFWNDKEGIAIGDGEDGCLSIIITRDGGHNWTKLPCNVLPDLSPISINNNDSHDDVNSFNGVGAFAASNTNIEILGDNTWVMTSRQPLLFSSDKGKTWEAIITPINTHEYLYQGIYSIDFFDKDLGYGIGGSFDEPEGNSSNKIITKDGGKTWQLIADGEAPGYKSCVQFVPNSGGKDLISIGFTGIDYSNDGGASWKQLSEEGFYTIRFLNDSIAYAAGKYRIARLTFN